MARYSGHEVDKVKPQLNTPQDGPELTEEQVRSWWETFSTNASAGEELGVSFQGGKNLYYYTDEGNFARAVNEGEIIDNPEVQKRLMENSLYGRLFTRTNDDVTPRQVVTKMEDQELEVGVASAGGFNEFYDDFEVMAPPKPLPFWKYLLWPFSSAVRKEIKTHQQETAKYNAAEKDFEWLDGLENRERACIREDWKEVFDQEQERKEQERLKEEARKRREAQLKAEKEAAEKEAADKKAYKEEHAKKKEKWNKDLGTASGTDFSTHRRELDADAENGKIVRDIVGNKHADYEEVMDGIVRMLEHGIYKATYDFMNVAGPNTRMVQQKPWQKAREGLRDYLNGKLDENLVKAALKGHERDSAATNALVNAVQGLVDTLAKDKDYFKSKGVVTVKDIDDIPLEVEIQATRLVHQHRRAGNRKDNTQHLDDSLETFQKEHALRKEKWDKDVSKMTLDEFREYRAALLDTENYDNRDDYYDIVTHPLATVDEVYDYIAREMEALMYIDHSSKSDVIYHLRTNHTYDKQPDLTDEFLLVQRDSWQKAKQAMNQFARDNISEKEVQEFLNKHNFEEKARQNFGKKIVNAYQNVKDKFREMGVVFKASELTPEVIRDMLVVKAQREGPEAIKTLAEDLKQQVLQKSGAQPTVQQPQVTQVKPMAPTVK